MSRDIKFRCWNTKLKCWGGDIRIGVKGVHAPSMRDDDVQNRGDFYKIMQYTGLHDRNGKEIYEGDILLDKEGFNFGGVAEKTVVEWDGFCGWNPWSRVVMAGRGAFSEPDKYVEVIGNIYENGDFLK